MWSINDVLLQIIRLGAFIICVVPKLSKTGENF